MNAQQSRSWLGNLCHEINRAILATVYTALTLVTLPIWVPVVIFFSVNHMMGESRNDWS